MMKAAFEKGQPEVFNIPGLQLLSKLNHGNANYPSFENKFLNVFNKHSPKKTKVCFRGN